MRKGKLNAQGKTKVKQHTPTERLALRRKKRKEGPSGKRRAERRHEVIDTLACGCRKTRVCMLPCAEHTAGTPVYASRGSILTLEDGTVLAEIKPFTLADITVKDEEIRELIDDQSPIWDGPNQIWLPSRKMTREAEQTASVDVPHAPTHAELADVFREGE